MIKPLNGSGLRSWPKIVLATLLVTAAALSSQAQAPAPAAPVHSEAADRLAIRALIDAYSHHADRREADRQVALFTSNAVVEIYEGEPGPHKPVAVLHGRPELLKGFAELKKYDVTQHVNGQNTLTINGDRATGETYCLAHHLWLEQGQRTLMVMGIRYYDTFTWQANQWLFAERKLIIDWVDRRPSRP